MITYPNLYHLKYFCDAVELGSISAAAQKNLVTHPAISRAITSLELYLGISLLDHQKKSFNITPAGYKIAEQANVLLRVAKDFEKLNLKNNIDQQLSLKIGVSKSLSEYYLYPLLSELKNDFPLLNVQVKFGTTNEIIGAVANGAIDLGLTIGSQNLPTLKQTIVKKGHFLLVENILKSNEAKELDVKKFILTEPRFETEKLKSVYKKKFGKNLKSEYEISSWEAIGSLVKKGFGVGLLPDIVIQNWKENTYRVLKTSSWFECQYEIVLHSLKTSPNNKFIELARNIVLKKQGSFSKH